jgi:hypothetical protein
MTHFLRTHWRKLSTGILAFTLLGAGGMKAYEALTGDCCAPGSPCCYPGSPCCHGQHPAKDAPR